ncbi:MAG: amidohydrolase [Pararhodobacter sp.]|nr:amidohydrolase [Pararhodobacter sp.]
MQTPDIETLLLHRGRIYRHAHDQAPAQAILLRGTKVVWIGPSADAPPAKRKIDLQGASVFPGLTDSHLHLFTLALARRQISFLASGASSINSVLEIIRRDAGCFGPNDWVQGCELNESLLAEKRLPHRRELDEALPDRPVLIRRYCGHVAVFNTCAMRALGIDEFQADPSFGHYERYGDGAINGIAFEEAAARIFGRAPAPDTHAMASGIRQVIDTCLGYGLTALTEAAVGFSVGYEREAQTWAAMMADADLPVRISLMPQMTAPQAMARGLQPVSDADWSVDTLKFFADGIVGGRTAAVSDPFIDRGGTGLFMLPEDMLAEQIIEAHNAGWRVAVHATGDRAIARVVDAFETAQRERPRPELRHRIEHCFVPPEGIFSRIAALRAQVVMQPSFLWGMGQSALAGLGPQRMRTAYPGRAALAGGADLIFSSDAPTGSLSPWRGIQAAVERKSQAGTPLGQPEALTVAEALACYINGGVVSMRQEGMRGKLVPGYLADLVVLDRDPFAVPTEDLHRIGSVMTVVRGDIVHNALSHAA